MELQVKDLFEKYKYITFCVESTLFVIGSLLVYFELCNIYLPIFLFSTNLLLLLIAYVYCIHCDYDSKVSQIQKARHLQSFLHNYEVLKLDNIIINGIVEPAKNFSGDFLFYNKGETASGREFIRLFIGDVQGHGLDASFWVLMITGIINNFSDLSLTTSELCMLLNESINKLNVDKDKGIAICVMTIYPNNNKIKYTSCGMPPIIKVDEEEIEFINISDNSLPLGIIESQNYNEKTLDIDDGIRYIITSDGLLELENSNNEVYEDFIVEDILHSNKFDPDDTAEYLIKSSEDFSKDILDDRTVVVIDYEN